MPIYAHVYAYALKGAQKRHYLMPFPLLTEFSQKTNLHFITKFHMQV